MKEEIKKGDIYLYCAASEYLNFFTAEKCYTIIDPTPDDWGVIRITCDRGKYKYGMPLKRLKDRFVKVDSPSFFIKELFDSI